MELKLKNKNFCDIISDMFSAFKKLTTKPENGNNKNNSNGGQTSMSSNLQKKFSKVSTEQLKCRDKYLYSFTYSVKLKQMYIKTCPHTYTLLGAIQ